MKWFWLLVLYGIAVLVLSVSLGAIFLYYSVSQTIQTEWFTVIAEGFGFLGLGLVELTIFWTQRDAERARVPSLTIEYDPVGLPDVFVQQLELVSEGGQKLNITRRFIRVVVKNAGQGVAEQCKATLKITKWDPQTRAPSKEAKPLKWESGSYYQDIGARGGSEILHVILSDSRFEVPAATSENYHALVSTPDTVNNLNIIRAQDALGIGDFEFELMVRARSGQFVMAAVRARITTDWRNLLLERLS